MPNLKAKTRKVNDPYEVWVDGTGQWEWRVLKHYQTPEKEATNPYARTFCAVKGPGTFDGYDMGDTYIHDYSNYATCLDEAQMALHLLDPDNHWREY